MATKPPDFRLDEIFRQIDQLWSWVRTLPAYKSDYKTMCKIRAQPRTIPRGQTILGTSVRKDSCEKRFTKRWGFYPLHDPADTQAPQHFIKELTAMFGMDSVKLHTGMTRTYMNPSSKVKGFNVSRRMRAVNVPERIVLTIDPTQPISVVQTMVEYYIKNAQREYKIKPRRPRTEHLSETYKVHVLRQLGVSRKKIRDEIINPVDQASFLDPKDSHRKRIARTIQRAKKTVV